MDNTKNKLAGIGLDIGTMNIVSARKGDADNIKTRRVRDVFLDLPLNAKKMLKISQVDFIEREDDILILGDPALEVANIFGREARRPLSGGIISSTEIDSLEVLSLLIKNALGDPVVPNEICYFSVPAAPIDILNQDIVYHRSVFERIISQLGYKPIASNEAMAIIYAETANEGFSGIGISFGSGMSNVALAVNTIEGLSFSVARSGDWIDQGAAKSLGSTASRICAIKEKGFDLMQASKTREQEAIAFYYRAMIDYALENLTARFKLIQNQFTLPKPIPIIVSGGSSLVGGFMGCFKEVFNSQKKFPIEISEIRQASNPLNAVANGLLVQALQEE